MKTAVINFRVEPELRDALQAAASEVGLSVGLVLTQMAKEFVSKKEITFYPFEPNEATKRSMDKLMRGEEELSESFDTPKEAADYLRKELGL